MTETSTSGIQVRLPRNLAEQIRKIATRHDRSLSAELRVALNDYVRRMALEEGDQG